jgi:CubicO group peptidase (beta-lactamase class C family)
MTMKDSSRNLTIALAAVVVTTALTPDAVGAPSPRNRSVGRTRNLGSINPSAPVSVPTPDAEASIVGIAVRGSDNHTFAWYADLTFSEGSTSNFEEHEPSKEFSIDNDGNYQPHQIVAMAMNNSAVYTYLDDGKYLVGRPDDLDAFSFLGPRDYLIPMDRNPLDLVGVAINPNNSKTYAWWVDGMVTNGTASEPGYSTPLTYQLPSPRKIGHILGIAISGNGRTHAWYHDVESGPGHSSIRDEIDARVMSVIHRYRLPGMGISASKNGRIVLEKGYGYADFGAKDRMRKGSRCRIGSVSKIVTAISAMQLHEQNNGFEVDDYVYGPGLFSGSGYTDARQAGSDRYQPIVAKAMDPLGRVVTYYGDRTYSIGTPENPDFHQPHASYDLAPGRRPKHVRGIAIEPSGRTWAWYDDQTFSAGSMDDLDSEVPRIEYLKATIPETVRFAQILGMDFSANGMLYVFYDNGERSVGAVTNFAAFAGLKTFQSTPSSTAFDRRYDIVGIGIDKAAGGVFAFYSDGTVTDGWSRDLDASGSPRSYPIQTLHPPLGQDWMDWTDSMQVDHLLSHSAGLDGGGDVEGASDMFGVDVSQLAYGQLHKYMLRSRKLLFRPGTSEAYSNHGMGLVSWVVERVSGMSFEDYVRSNVFDPLGIVATTNHDPDIPGDTRRHRYSDDGDLESYEEVKEHNLGLGAGGWKISAGDLVRLMVGTNTVGGHPQVFASDGTRQLMETQPHPASDYAHGWGVSGSTLRHNGALDGGNTLITKYDRGTMGSGPSNARINVAVCTPIRVGKARGGMGVLEALSNDIAHAVADGVISSSYDLY